MIKRWRLKNFKSFHKLPPLELSPINVLAGANSSGKSSIIQSILLLKQTLQYGSENRTVTLNGPLLRLGAFEDVRNFEATGESLDIGFEFEFTENDFQGSAATPWLRNLRRHSISSDSGSLRNLSLNLSYKGGSEAVEQALLQLAGPAMLSPELIETTLRISRSSSSEAIKETFASYTKRRSELSDDEVYAGSLLHYEVILDDDSTREIFSGKPEASIRGGLISYFLPSWTTIHYNSAAQKAIKITEDIFNSATTLLSSSNLTDEVVPRVFVDIVNKWLSNHNAEPISVGDGSVLAVNVHERLKPFLRRNRYTLGITLDSLMIPTEKITTEVTELREQLLQVMIEDCAPNYDFDLETPKGIGTAVDFIKDFFKHGIRYLGPLRDSPRPVYQLEALESTTDVGYRGEHTAAVLDLNSSKRISYQSPPSESAELDYGETSQTKFGSVHDAVVEWLVYLGVADDVVTTDAGVFGNRLQVSTDGLGRLHDLTNVGVGVSQVLPIVVMALLAPKGSFLIFEQPELHLHPKVQARLADFFLALAMDGKQTLLETHSEYLVDRFRLRIALSQDDSVRPLINILFSEKRGGQSKLTPIEISEYGSIINWPDDFFEQTQRDVGRIVRAASEKRRTKPRK